MKHTFAGLALAVAALSATTAGAEDLTAYLGRTYTPGATDSVEFYMWNASSFEVTEYRLEGSALEGALRANSLRFDDQTLTPLRSETFSGNRGTLDVPSQPGVYVWVSRAPGQRARAQAALVSDLRLAVKRDHGRSLLLASTAAGDPGRGTQVDVFALDNDTLRAVGARRLGAWGMSSLATPDDEQLVYLARRGEHVAVASAYVWRGQQRDKAGHVQTDRPLYRPGQLVHFRGILRDVRVASSSYTTPAGEDVRLFLRRPDGEQLSLGTRTTSAYGTVNGSYSLNPGADLGNYVLELQAEAGGSWSYVASVPFSVEAYRKPEFKVEITPARESYVRGQEVQAEIAADYFFGAPVADAQVSYRVTRRPRVRWWNPWIRPMVASIWWPPFRWDPPAVVEQGNVRLDANGRAPVRFTATPDADSEYTIEARITDASNREISGSATVTVSRAAFDLVLATDRYVYQPGDLVELQANLGTPDGAPVANTNVELTIERVDPADGSKQERFSRTLTTDLEGTAKITLRATTQNNYHVTARATDAAGNPVDASRTIWVHDRRSGQSWTFDQLEITADKDSYAVGDVAALLIKAPVDSGLGALSVESSEMHTRRGFRVNGGTALVNVRITADMSPNAFASVLVPGRDGQVRQAQVELKVPPVDKLVQVTVEADRASYEPGDRATFRIKASDHLGNPVRAEVALGVVDEALFALREDQTTSLADTFYGERHNQVQTVGALGGGGWVGGPFFPGGPRVLAMAESTRAAAPTQGNSGVRDYFPDTLRWVAAVETDVNGEAVITQDMADSLTTWRLTARAITRDTQVGTTSTQTLVRKDLLVRLATPRTLVEGDELTLVGVVHNLAADGTPGADNAQVRVGLEARGLRVSGSPWQTVSVRRNGSTRVTWPVIVTDAGQVELTARAEASFEQDALRVELPVRAKGVVERESRSGALRRDGWEDWTFTKDPRAIDGATELRIEVAPSLAGTLLDSLDYLAGYPYGCVEQTMSRFLPTVIVAEVLKTLNRRDPALEAELPLMVQQGFDRLQSLQNADGGYGWFGGNGSHPYVSAYVLYGLGLAQRNGFNPPSDTLDKLSNFLEAQVRAGGDPDGVAYQLYALTTAGRVLRPELVAAAGSAGQLNAYTKATLALALKAGGEGALAQDLVGQLLRQAQSANGQSFWRGDSLRYGSWTSNDVETTAYVVRALLAVDPQHPKLAEGLAWLLTQRSGNGRYVTTKDTAAVVLTLAEYVTVSRELDPQLDVTLTVNGQQRQLSFDWEDLGKPAQVITIPGDRLRDGANTVRLDRNGRGVLYFTATLEQTVRRQRFNALDRGIQVRREFFTVTESVDANGQVLETETPLSGAVKIGDRVRVKLEVGVSAGGTVEHVNIEDRFPVGFEVVQEEQRPAFWGGWTWWRSAKEIHDDKVVFFATSLRDSGQTYSYSYDLRAEVGGRFFALPCFAEAVYAPATHGRSTGVTIRVRPN